MRAHWSRAAPLSGDQGPLGVERTDHIVAGAILLVSLVQAFADPEVIKQAPRLTFFKAGAATGLMMGLLILLMWHVSARPIAGFGLLEWVGPSPLASLAVAAAWPLLLLAAARLLLGRFRTAAAQYYGGYAHLMPRSRREIPAAYAAGTLAAFGEEIAYRGFFIWYLHAWAGLSGAVLASSAVFGIAHGYQGRNGMIFATIAGVVLACAYLLSGSLLLVLWMHASYNVASFTLGYRLLHAPNPGVDPAHGAFHSEPPQTP